ncbi:MFS multidrug transporter [Piedraia hortae CBS 480.64]|uniref:Cercosporin MFS transporter CTB4 n=1 Tax=Piedraia hortae CBS 480.64 TaxID=1314780 RepID=A0A6A7BZH2_9PEZI|nr:MFS multidrug transporter [Piedraia hortae CBS 480.64]
MEYLSRHPTALQRIQEQQQQHENTVGGHGFSQMPNEKDLPPFGGGKPYPPMLPAREEYVVEFNGHDDPAHAQNWPTQQKLVISAILILDALSATFASAIFGASLHQVTSSFHVSKGLFIMSTSLFILGYACGPVVFAPMSELYGRRVAIISGAFGFAIFNLIVALSQDIPAMMVARFLGGFFGSSPLTIVGAVFADMYSNQARGVAVAAFSAAVISGPFLGPLAGDFIVTSTSWRWTAYIPSLMGLTSGILACIYQRESYGPVILVQKAAELRRLTHNWGIHAKQEEVEISFKELISKNFSRPLRILFTEPIALLVTIYMSFIYALMFLNLVAYSYVFGKTYHWELRYQGLPSLALVFGLSLGLLVTCLSNRGYVIKLHMNENIPVPEWRLPQAIAGGISFAIGLFWLGWSTNPAIHWSIPALAGVPLGFGIFSVFLQFMNYLIDSYLMFAASAIAANTIMRSVLGAIFPMLARYLFNTLGITWGLTVLGMVATIFIPIPLLFLKFGARIRKRSKIAPAKDVK